MAINFVLELRLALKIQKKRLVCLNEAEREKIMMKDKLLKHMLSLLAYQNRFVRSVADLLFLTNTTKKLPNK